MPTKNKKPQAKPLWGFDDFYNAFHSCDVTKAAMEAGDLSTRRGGLSKYLDATKKGSISGNNESELVPSPYGELLKLQKSDGKWVSPEAVLRCLGFPANLSIDGANAWQSATAFAIASIRQQYHLFDVLSEAHDRGSMWLSSNNYVSQALEVLCSNRSKAASSQPSSSNMPHRDTMLMDDVTHSEVPRRPSSYPSFSRGSSPTTAPMSPALLSASQPPMSAGITSKHYKNVKLKLETLKVQQ